MVLSQRVVVGRLHSKLNLAINVLSHLMSEHTSLIVIHSASGVDNAVHFCLQLFYMNMKPNTDPIHPEQDFRSSFFSPFLPAKVLLNGENFIAFVMKSIFWCEIFCEFEVPKHSLGTSIQKMSGST